MERVYISLGSNSGNSDAIVLSALTMIAREFNLSAVSNLYRTSPQIIQDQADFLNCAACFSVSSDKTATQILQGLQNIEAIHGRNRSQERKSGPRTLDIDIVFFGNQIIDLPALRIPHPAYRLRRFVLIPLMDIDPNMADPETGRSVRDYAQDLEHVPKQGIYLWENLQYNDFTSKLRKRV